MSQENELAARLETVERRLAELEQMLRPILADSLKDRVLVFLQLHSSREHPQSCVAVAKALNAKGASVRQAIRRMAQRGLCKQSTPGWYYVEGVGSHS